MKKIKLLIGIIAVAVIGLTLLFLRNKQAESTYVEVLDKNTDKVAAQNKADDSQAVPAKQVALKYSEASPISEPPVYKRSKQASIDSPADKQTQQASLVTDDDIRILKSRLLKKGIYFGTAMGPQDIMLAAPRPKDFLTRVAKYFNYYTIPITFGVTELAGRGVFNFKFPDKTVEFAIANGAKIKGHVLVLGSPLPNWLINGHFSNQELQDILKNHIQTIIKHFKDKYPGAITCWNVVNEPVCNGGRIVNPLKCTDYSIEKNVWTDIRMPGSDDPTDYIKLAFKWAHEADPAAKLYLNENGIEVETDPKVDRVVQLVQHLKQEGVPIDGVGIQAHLRLYLKDKYSSQGLTNIMNRFAALGLETQISEFDVIMASGLQFVNANTPTTQLAIASPQKVDFVAQAQLYKMFLDGCLHAKNCTGFTTWGAWDNTSWTAGHWKGSFYPHLLDGDMKPKVALKYMVDEAKSYK